MDRREFLKKAFSGAIMGFTIGAAFTSKNAFSSSGTKITWLGHAAFRIDSPGGKIIYIDPFLRGNPKTPARFKKVRNADLILVTHGHVDHVGDTISIARTTGARVVAQFELVNLLVSKGLDRRRGIGMNKGGTVNFDGISITQVDAVHSSSLMEGDRFLYAGEPTGFVLKVENGYAIYHTGDTGLFSGMSIIGQLYKVDLALMCIGDFYTMGPREAAVACSMIRPAKVVPMHYGTWPVLQGNPADFGRFLRKFAPDVKLMVMKPGSSMTV